MIDTYDYGFSFSDPETEKTESPELLSLIEQHKQLVTNEVRQKLKEVEQLILPLLVNLQKNPEKDYIHWPNRLPIIQQQIEKITKITRHYDQ